MYIHTQVMCEDVEFYQYDFMGVYRRSIAWLDEYICVDLVGESWQRPRKEANPLIQLGFYIPHVLYPLHQFSKPLKLISWTT